MLDPVRAKARLIGVIAASFVGGVMLASAMEWTAGSEASTYFQTQPAAGDVRPLAELSESFISIAESVTPAVVSIRTQRSPRAALIGPPVPHSTETGAGLGGKLHIVCASPDVSVTTGDTHGDVKHVSIKAQAPDREVAFVSVLVPGNAPRVEWKVKGGKGTLSVNGDKHEFAKTSAGWVPTKIDGEKVPRPETPEDRMLKAFEK